MITAASRPLTSDESIRLEDFTRRRLAGEPVARILGLKEFWGLPLQLSAATLVPRPDTETVVELALEMLRASPPSGRPLRIADLGTGSGAILLALLSELPDAFGYGTDISVDALRTARGNAVDLGLASRAEFLACDYAAALSGTIRSDRVEPALYPLRRYRRVSPPRSAITIRCARWTAAPMGSTPTARSFRRRRDCWHPAASSPSRSARAKAPTWND